MMIILVCACVCECGDKISKHGLVNSFCLFKQAVKEEEEDEKTEGS